MFIYIYIYIDQIIIIIDLNLNDTIYFKQVNKYIFNIFKIILYEYYKSINNYLNRYLHYITTL